LLRLELLNFEDLLVFGADVVWATGFMWSDVVK
jgi:hypothetical protein